MDIRNFFGAKKPKSGGKTTSTNSNSSSAKKQKSSVSKSRSSGKRKNNEEDEEPKKAGMTRKTSLLNRNKSGASIKRRSNDRVEVSAADFFADSAAAPPPKKQQKPSPRKKKSTVVIEDSSEDEEQTPTSSPKISQKPSTIPRNTRGSNESASKKPAVVTIDSKPPSKKRVRSILDESDDEDAAVVPGPSTNKPPPKKKAPPPPSKSTASRKRTTTKKSAVAKVDPPILPSLELDSFDVDDAVSQCLEGVTIVFSGVLEGLGRLESEEMVKILGGRATSGVSGKTTYLVLGETLEDGRPYTEGRKYKQAVERGTIQVVGVQKFYGLLKMYNDRAKAKQENAPSPSKSQMPASRVGSASNDSSTVRTVSNASTVTVSSASSKPAPVNPYTKKPVNPYAKHKTGVSNPYASSKPSASKAHTSGGGDSAAPSSHTFDPLALWADAHAPTSTNEILGNQSSVRALKDWLKRWETTFNHPKAHGKVFSSPKGPWKAALLSGPPGIGKTTTATLVAKEAGRDLLELNASDSRGKKALSQNLGDVTGSQVLDFGADDGKKRKGPPRLRCIIMDEVDGMGAGDRSGMAELISMIKKSMVPIICICNDRQSQKIKSLAPYCMDLRYKRPNKSVIARRAIRIGQMHGMKIEQNAAEAISESCGNDIRQVVNSLQMWASKGDRNTSLTYKELKERERSMNKDEMLRVNMFDACKLIVEGPRNLADADPKTARESFFKRSDAYFVDYSLMGLLVHQNYPKVLQSGYSTAKRTGSPDELQNFLDRMYDATFAMSDFAVTENAVRSGDQNWGLLPTCAALAVKTGFHAGGKDGGFLSGFPEFAGWLGKNSSRGKKSRLLRELGHHMNYKVSGGTTELRLAYLPLLRQHFQTYLTDPDPASRMEEMIGVMDEYGLDRDDIFENMDEFKMDSKAEALNNILDSKQKASFTRLYNSGAHKSQALVAEQGAGKVSKKRKSTGDSAPKELGAIDEDGGGTEDDDDEEEELTEEKLRALFKSKGRKRSQGKKSGKSAGASKKRKASGKRK